MYTSLSDLYDCPLFRPQSLKHVPINSIVKNLTDFKKSCSTNSDKASPDAHALRFYYLNHLMAEMRNRVNEFEPLQGADLKLLCVYRSEVAFQSRRMFAYLLYICTRELRHMHDTSVINDIAKLTKVGHETWLVIKDKGGSSVQTWLEEVDLSHTTIDEYTEGLALCFHNGKFSNGYGGVAWGNIADVLHAFCRGSLSAEMLLDQSYHLAHNNGAIFNKGMVYHMYESDLKVILDVQRSGQIPNLVHNNKAPDNTGGIISSELIKDMLASSAFTGLPDVGTVPVVDWVAVKEAGSMGSYHTYIKAQTHEDKPKVSSQPSTGSMSGTVKHQQGKPVTVYAGTSLFATQLDRGLADEI